MKLPAAPRVFQRLMDWTTAGPIWRVAFVSASVILGLRLAALPLFPPSITAADMPRDETMYYVGGESDNPRDYDPATGRSNRLVFSGLVAFSPQLEVVPDLAEKWDVSPDGTVYTFHLRKEARFHNGRAVTAADVVYSWERAASPAVDSNTVLIYLGDIVGTRDRRAGKTDHIAGLKVLNDHTLQVTIDAPKFYFLMKLTYGTAAVVDRANVESRKDWYRSPNGTGPYKLIRWDPLKVQIYERNDGFYLGAAPIRYVVVHLYAGQGTRMFESGEIDLAYVGPSNAARVRDPGEPLHQNLVEGVDMCTSKVTFDVAQPPFDDPKVRQAFALSVDKQRYVDVALRGVGIPAHGLYPPSLPGYDPDFEGLQFNPQLARQRLSESRYGSAAALPPIVLTTSGFGSELSLWESALAEMWRSNLGVSIEFENLEPDKYMDELYAGRHGQVIVDVWCADYPDPENFADVLFHSGAEQNNGNYSNPALDSLLERARVERDVARRLEMYNQAERIIVEDAAAIFVSHDVSLALVSPRVQGYEWTPIDVPIQQYLSLVPEP